MLWLLGTLAVVFDVQSEMQFAVHDKGIYRGFKGTA